MEPTAPPVEQPPQHLTSPPPVSSRKFPLGLLAMLILLALLTISTAFLAYQNMQLQKQISAPQTYEDCAILSGSRIQESYPATCVTADGLRFTQPITPSPQDAEIPQTPQTSPTQKKYTCPSSGWADCMPGPGKNMSGCSPEAMTWYKANCPNFQGGAY